jgi:predicted metalloprotease with PDZ domain
MPRSPVSLTVLCMFMGVLLVGSLLATPVQMEVDLTDSGRRVVHAVLTFPAQEGEMTLVYPKWIPGEHAPSGPITDLAGIRVSVGGQELDWWRDPSDMFTIRTDVPSGEETLRVELDFLSAPPNSGKFTASASATTRLAVVNWNQLLLYPAGARADEFEFDLTVHLPQDWHWASALPVKADIPGQVDFATVTLERLIDSPLVAGLHYKKVDLTPDGGVPHFLHLFCEQSSGLKISEQQSTSYRKLVREALALFGSHHYGSYHFLLTMSDYIAHFGLEHHESSDNRLGESMMVNKDKHRLSCSLLPHEMIHSWNGKYRRPAGMARENYQQDKVTDLLWVYEGLTHYYTMVLTARSGLWQVDWTQNVLADYAQWLQDRKGRAWRPLEDTAVSAQLLFSARRDWASWRRGVDFYREGVFIWLEVDAIIRRESAGRKSLDDFCRNFFGNESGGPAVVPYQLDELVEALDKVQGYHWHAHLMERVRSRAANAPLAGLELCGWRLDHGPERSEFQRTSESSSGGANLTASIGIAVSSAGKIGDVIPGTAADRAGLAPGMVITAVNDKKYSTGLLRDAVKASDEPGQSLELLVENSGYFRTYKLGYSLGARFAKLQRLDGDEDLLEVILRPLTDKAQKR